MGRRTGPHGWLNQPNRAAMRPMPPPPHHLPTHTHTRCRFSNASAAQGIAFHRRHPRILPAACRLMSIPVVVFGPGIGVPAAILMYGVRTPSSMSQALRLRKWSAWVRRAAGERGREAGAQGAACLSQRHPCTVP